MVQHDETPSPWQALHAAPRMRLDALDRDAVPSSPGVIALWREDRLAWLSKSASLRGTLQQVFATQGPSAISPLRRTVAAFLGLSASAAIAAGRYRPTPEDHARISRWLREASVSCLACSSESEAVRLEARLATERDEPPANASAPMSPPAPPSTQPTRA